MIRDRRWQTKMANPSALWYYKTWRPTLCLDRGDPAQSDTSPAHTHTYTHTHLLITVFCSSSLAWWKRLWQRKTFPSNWPPKMWLSSRFDWTHNSPAHLRPLTVELPSYSSLILTSCLELVQLFAIFFFFGTNFGQTFFFFCLQGLPNKSRHAALREPHPLSFTLHPPFTTECTLIQGCFSLRHRQNCALSAWLWGKRLLHLLSDLVVFFFWLHAGDVLHVQVLFLKRRSLLFTILASTCLSSS